MQTALDYIIYALYYICQEVFQSEACLPWGGRHSICGIQTQTVGSSKKV